jgi:DNA-binding transcriptional ArsR family regulator
MRLGQPAPYMDCYRDVARRLGVSKDTVGRRMAVLRGARVVVELGEDSVDRFETRSYQLYLDFVGVTREPARMVP